MKPNTVLIVDDQKFNLDVLLRVLGDEYQVRIALDGLSALDLAAQEVPDLILLDIGLPDLSGFDVCRRLRENPVTAGAIVIFLTGMSDPESEIRGLSLGAVDFIAKPFNLALVQARVRSHLSLLNAHRELLIQRDILAKNEKLVEMGHLLAVMAHELNTPLGNAFLANSRLESVLGRLTAGPAEAGPPGEEAADCLALSQMVDAGLRRGIHLIRQVRMVYLERHTEEVSPVDLSLLFEQVLSQRRQELLAGGWEVGFEGVQGLQFPLAMADFTELLSEMLSLSLMALPEPRAGKKVTVGFRLADDGQLCLSYRDPWFPLAPTDADSFFEPVFHPARQGPGSGVSTFLIHAIVANKMGGTIRAERVGDSGLAIQATIPPAARTTGVTA